MGNVERGREIRGPANDRVPAQVIKNRQMRAEEDLRSTYGGVLGNDLAVGQSQETLVNSCLVQLWQAYQVARCARSSSVVWERGVGRLLTLVCLLWVVHQGLYHHFDLGAQRLCGV